MNFSDWKLSLKLTVGFAFVVTFAITIGVIGVTQMEKIEEADKTLFEKGAIPLGDMIDVATTFQRIRVNVGEMIIATDQTRINEFANKIIELDQENDKDVENLAKTMLTEEGRKELKDTQIAQANFMEVVFKIIKLSKEGKKTDAIELMNGDGFKASKIFQEELDSLVESKKKGAATISENNTATAEKSANLIIAIISMGTMAAIFIAFIIIKNVTSTLSNISNNLGEASGQVASASDQLSGASQTLSNASSEQASSIEETSASLEEMNGMIENNLKSAEKAKELADSVRGIADKGNEAMSELVRSMQEILEANTNIEKLVRVIGEIGDKTKVIDEIVFQTKLLSFNASVEAERAGEHGRGFAVVAQEVGNLAQMSGKAALEISGIVKESIKNAEQITTDNKKKVEKGNELVKSTAVLLKETTEKATTVSGSATQVVEASKEQAAGIRQITNAMDQLNKATQQNAATAEEAASSSEELAAQAETMNGLVADLNELVLGKGNVIPTHKELMKKTLTKTKPVGVVKNLVKKPAKKEILAHVENPKSNDEWEQL